LHHLGGDDVKHALIVLQQQGIEVDQLAYALWHSVCHATDADTSEAVTYQDHVLQVALGEEVCDVLDESL